MRSLCYLFVCVFVVTGGILARAVELKGQPQVTTTAKGAKITWKTDVDCGTRLEYGLNAAQLSRKAEGPVSSLHEVALEGLAAGTTYHFSLGSARTKLATGTFTTGGAAPAASPQPSFMRRVLDAIAPEKKSTDSPRSGAATQALPSKAPPTRQTWGYLDSLQDHFDRHGRDFGSQSPDEYAAQAWLFLQRARAESLPTKVDDTDGTLRVFDPKTRTFAAYNRTGRTKTFFKPDSPGYWERQPGRALKPAELKLAPGS